MVDALTLNSLYSGLGSAQSASGFTVSDAFGAMLSEAIAKGLESSGEAGAEQAANAANTDALSGILGGDSASKSLLLLVLMGAMDGSSGAAMAASFAAAMSDKQAGTNSAALPYALRAYGAGTASAAAGASSTAAYTEASDRIPARASKAVNPAVTSSQGNRSAELYTAVIRQFNVTQNPRYEVNKDGAGDTYCNIFMWDVTRAMGAEIPHYIDPATKAPRYYPDTKGAKEMTANDIYDWLHQVGTDYGWHKVTPEQAQELANKGHPVVTAMKNEAGHGHVQVVCPSKDGTYDPKRGVTIAQAGRNLYDYAYVTQVYSGSLPKLTYFAHK